MTFHEILTHPYAVATIPAITSAIVSALISGFFVFHSTKVNERIASKAIEREENLRRELRKEIQQQKEAEHAEKKARQAERKKRIRPKFRVEKIEQCATRKQQETYLAFIISLENTGGDLMGATIEPDLSSTKLKYNPRFRAHSTETLRFTSEEEGHIGFFRLKIRGTDTDGDPVEISVPITWSNGQYHGGDGIMP
ncbi:hypothetical protein [Pseudomonas oryziphila]|uniref:Uncharacterized protein n=1 Tax=Pseudomonas entomophila TaxID=312306 RepID=A0A3S8UP29_9PSED|nr:hypothetical protein [Pseudomonas oryziphila]AZL70139.1 hypothetical protein EJA05_21520 [Pseudomonas oryziphila]